MFIFIFNILFLYLLILKFFNNIFFEFFNTIVLPNLTFLDFLCVKNYSVEKSY